MLATKTKKSKTIILNDTIAMLQELDIRELEAVRSVVRIIVSKDENFYHPLTEVELMQRIDEAIAQTDAGLAVDSETFEAEIKAEFGL